MLEILIVMLMITIIGSVGYTSFVNSRINGREIKRRGDMLALQQSFEQYFADNNAYNAVNCQNMAGYIQGEYPTDPLGAALGHSDYAEDCDDVSQYCVCAELEREGTGNAIDDACDFSAGTRDYFCIENQQ